MLFKSIGSTAVIYFFFIGIAVVSCGCESGDERIGTDDINPDGGTNPEGITNPDGSFGSRAGLLELVEPLKISTATPSYVGKGAADALVKVTGRGFSSNVQITSEDQNRSSLYPYQRL